MSKDAYHFNKWGASDIPLFWEDLHRFSIELRAAFPTIVFFPPEFQSSPAMEKVKPSPMEPARTFHDIYSCIHGFAAYYNWGVCIRLASEEEIASGDPQRMIGGRLEPTAMPTERDFLEAAPQVYLWLHGPEECFLGMDYRLRNDVSHLMKPIHEYPPVRVLDCRGSGTIGAVNINGYYGVDDEKGKTFAKQVKSLLMRHVTKETALYDPRNGEIIENTFRHKWAVSRFGLEYCSLHEGVYMAKGPEINGIQTWIGPRQKLRDHIRAIGPSALEPRFYAEDFKGWSKR